ncbi:hypothetical protein HY405_00785 [Candidatus Microgenomates bacterium]|nr:hypothetical protein [Candidatus Microgenomates bacterium]
MSERPRPKPLEINLPETVTVTLRDPERSVLGTPSSRVLIDLLTVSGPIPCRDAEDKIQFYSFVYLSQVFGAIATYFSFVPESGYRPQPFPLDLSRVLTWESRYLDSSIVFVGSGWSISPKYQELLQAVGGPQTVKYPQIVGRLTELARLNKLIRFSKFVFLENFLANDLERKEITPEKANEIKERWFPEAEERESLKQLREEFELMSQKP